MTPHDAPDVPRFSVVRPDTTDASRAKRIITDGRGWIGVGGTIAGGFGVEAVKSLVTAESDGRWWLILFFVVGVAILAAGSWRERRRGRGTRVGIVVTAGDPKRVEGATELHELAEDHSRRTCTLTLKALMRFGEDSQRVAIDALAEEASVAVTMARRLTGSVQRFDLIPIMPLPAAFRFGAQLGHTHGSEIVVHALRQGFEDFFPATVLLDSATPRTPSPLLVEDVETIDGGDPSATALALDLQGMGAGFAEPVRGACERYGIGNLLLIRNPGTRLAEDRETFTACVDHICRTWRNADLPAAAWRDGCRHSAFLSGPVAISMAVGARLANNQTDHWTTYTFDGSYEPLR